MIIKSITIENFRSYYQRNSFEIGDGLTLIVGANGDGKSAFFDAVKWLLNTIKNERDENERNISKKKFTELTNSESAEVSVSMTYVNDGCEKTLSKSFCFRKDTDNNPSVFNSKITLKIHSGVESRIYEGQDAAKYFDKDFEPSVVQYCLFKGEEELDIFKQPNAMSFLVETFSQIKDFEPYLRFMRKAKEESEALTDRTIKADKKNSIKAQNLRSLIKNEEEKIKKLQEDYTQAKEEEERFQLLLDSCLENQDSYELMNDIRSRIETLSEQKDIAEKSLNEKYTYRLLDDSWILLGFMPIANEFGRFVAELELAKRKEEKLHTREEAAREVIGSVQKELNQGKIPLRIDVPDENTMREMLNDEVCKVCGTPAPKGSPAYNFMKKRLEDFLASINDTDEANNQEPELFRYTFIDQLRDMNVILNSRKQRIKLIKETIEKEIANNLRKRKKIDEINHNLENAKEEEKKLIASCNGQSVETLISGYRNLRIYLQSKDKKQQEVNAYNEDIKKHQELLQKYREDYEQLSNCSSAAIYSRSSKAIRHILEAFESAKLRNKREFLNKLESCSNVYMELLNKDDFRGSLRIKETINDNGQLMLVDVDGMPIYNANTALKTTMYMSLLFAVSNLTAVKHENDYPLLFDAPTSSFTIAKENDFFNVIGGIKKQIIIVSKTFLKEEDDKLLLDKERLDKLTNTIKYRISKKTGFNENDLSTIETVVERL